MACHSQHALIFDTVFDVNLWSVTLKYLYWCFTLTLLLFLGEQGWFCSHLALSAWQQIALVGRCLFFFASLAFPSIWLAGCCSSICLVLLYITVLHPLAVPYTYESSFPYTVVLYPVTCPPPPLQYYYCLSHTLLPIPYWYL